MISMIPAQYLAFSVDQVVSLFFKFLFSIGIFYPAGVKKRGQSPFFIFHFFQCHNNQNIKKGTVPFFLLCCGPFAVGYHSFMGRRLASAATSTREQPRLNSGQFIKTADIYI